MKTDLWVLAALYFGAVEAASASNDSQAILSSGTVKLGDWQDAYDKASAFVSSLSMSDKLSIITGGNATNFSAFNMLDSASNPVNYYYVTAWPAGLAAAMTWDVDVINKQGQALGAEFKGKGINVAYGPTTQPLGRSPWGGRTGETYGADSYMSGMLSSAVIRGMSSAGVIPCSKHYVLNEQETHRQGPPKDPVPGLVTDGSEAFNAIVDDKAFHETYLAPFYDNVKSGIGAIMCSMNRINGSYGCENHDTLSRRLKVELGFPGFVTPDAGAQKTGIHSANAGLDNAALDASGKEFWSNATLGAGIANGTFTEERLDDMVVRNLMGYFQLKQDAGYPAHAGNTDHVDVRGKHGKMARKIAAESLVLLKNDKKALPLTNERVISIFGMHAAPRTVGPNAGLTVLTGVGNTMDGHMTQVGGSAMSSNAFLVTPFQAFNERAETDGLMLKWWLNNTFISQGGFPLLSAPGTEITETTPGIADGSDACIVFVNAWGGEARDRTELANAEQDNLVNSVADYCSNTIVVVNTIGPRLLSQWDSHDNVTAIVYGGPLGQYSGRAINDVLFGDVNPSGKLVHTLAHNQSDYDVAVHISNASDIHYTEGNFIDYKYFDKRNITPAYEFGFGLSYTTFEYGSNLSVSTNKQALAHVHANGALAVGGREDLWDKVADVKVSIKNTGSVAGAEVAQMYVEFPEEADEPVRQLRGFKKVMVQPGETEEVVFELRRKDLSVWDVVAQEWAIMRGEYGIRVGASSRDIRADSTVMV